MCACVLGVCVLCFPGAAGLDFSRLWRHLLGGSKTSSPIQPNRPSSYFSGKWIITHEIHPIRGFCYKQLRIKPQGPPNFCARHLYEWPVRHRVFKFSARSHLKISQGIELNKRSLQIAKSDVQTGPMSVMIVHPLVGGEKTILKHDGVRQWEGWHPIYDKENKKMFETTNQISH